MRRFIQCACTMGMLILVASNVAAQEALAWDEVKARLDASNPTLRAGAIGIEQSGANEILAVRGEVLQ